MVGQLDLTQRVNLIQLIFALQQQDVAGMGQILRNLSVPFVDKVDEKAYARDFERVISRQMYVGGSAGFGQTVNLGLGSVAIPWSAPGSQPDDGRQGPDAGRGFCHPVIPRWRASSGKAPR